MKPKKQKQLNKNHSPSFWILIIVVPIVTLFCGLTAWINNEDQKVRHAEDITFTKIETFVDLVKVRLDQEVPEGKWEIYKSCHHPGDKGASDKLGCDYHVTSKQKVSDIQIIESIYTDFIVDGRFDTFTSDLSLVKSYGGDAPITNAGCGMTINLNDYHTMIGCSSSSHNARYPIY